MCAMASIDIPAMSSLVGAADGASSELPYDEWGFSSILGSVSLDASPAQGVGRVGAWLDSAIPGLKRRLALAQAIEAQTPGQQTSVQIDESTLSNVPPAQAQADGQAAAKKLRDAGGTIDPTLLAEIQRYQNDPYFAAGFATELSPTDLAHIVTMTSNNGRTTGSPVSDEYKNWFKQYQGLLSAMGSTVGTATRNTGNLALPPDYAQQWVNSITAQPGDASFHYGDAMSLGYLMRFGQYSTPFLDQVSTDVYNYERSQDGPVWGPRAGVTLDRPVDPTGNGLQVNVDTLSGVLAALGNNPVAAQHFFDVGNPNAKTDTVTLDGQKVTVNDRLKYLLLDRTWSSSAGSDEGKGLGLALEAGSTYFRDSGPQGAISAQIASQTLALLGNQIGSGDNDFGFGNTWNIYTQLRPSVARIVASYTPDLYRIIGNGNVRGDQLGGDWSVLGNNPGFPPGMPYGAELDPALMTKILQTLGEDQSNIQIVTAGAAATQQQLMGYALSRSLGDNANSPVMMLTGTNVPLIQNSASLNASVLGWIVNTAYSGDKNKEDADKKRAELLSKTLSIMTSLPCIPAPAGQWSKFLFDQVKSNAIDQIGKGPAGTATAVYGKMDAGSKQSLTQNTLNLMLQAGYLDPKYYAEANQKVGGQTYQPPPPTALKGKTENGTWVPDQPPQFDFGSPAYQTWSETYAPNAWLQNNVLGPYDNTFPNVR